MIIILVVRSTLAQQTLIFRHYVYLSTPGVAEHSVVISAGRLTNHSPALSRSPCVSVWLSVHGWSSHSRTTSLYRNVLAGLTAAKIKQNSKYKYFTVNFFQKMNKKLFINGECIAAALTKIVVNFVACNLRPCISCPYLSIKSFCLYTIFIVQCKSCTNVVVQFHLRCRLCFYGVA